MKKKILSLILIAFIVITSIQSLGVGAQNADSKVTFRNRSLSGVTKQSGAGTDYKWVVTSYNSNTIGYCLNRSLKEPPYNSTLSLIGDLKTLDASKSSGLVYILKNGWNGSTWNDSVMGLNLSNDEAYYATQLAVWMYQGTLSSSSLDQNDKVVRAAERLVQNARQFTQATPSIKLSINNNSSFMITKSNGVSVYRTNLMSVTTPSKTNMTISVENAPTGTQIISENGTNISSGSIVSSDTKFYIQIPESQIKSEINVTVRVKANWTVNRVYKYGYDTKGTYQDIGILVPTTETTEDTMKFNAKPYVGTSTPEPEDKEETGSLKITKVDQDGDKLSGAKLVVEDENGKEIASWTTTKKNNPYTIDDLPFGTYTIIEESAPNGYKKASEITAKVKENKTTEVSVVNKKKTTKKEKTKTGTLEVTKIDTTDGKNTKLSGVELLVKDEDGNTVASWTTNKNNNPYTIDDLEPGVYTIIEKKAPEGYTKSQDIEVTVKENKVSEVTVENKKKPEDKTEVPETPETPKTSIIKISKQDITTKKELKDAHLTIKDEKGNIVAEWVSTDEPHYIYNLAAGNYILIETRAPEGYGLSDEIINFTVEADGGIEKTVVMYNSQIPNTADLNMTAIILGFIISIGCGVFGFTKLNKQQ